MSENVHTENYKGYEIEIYQDEFAENPFESWDSNPPLAVLGFGYGGRSDITEYATQYGNANNVPSLDRAQIIANMAALCELCEVKNVWELTEGRRDYSPLRIVNTVNDAISYAIDRMDNSDRLEALASLYNMAGIPAVVRSVHGYSQGDYWEVLAVATPKFQDACGNGAEYWNDTKNLESSIELFKDWCIGDVYGYSVLDADGETLDSCFGFYGDYDDPYNALSEAYSAIDYRIESDRKARLQQVKTWIKNRVPLIYRNFAV